MCGTYWEHYRLKLPPQRPQPSRQQRQQSSRHGFFYLSSSLLRTEADRIAQLLAERPVGGGYIQNYLCDRSRVREVETPPGVEGNRPGDPIGSYRLPIRYNTNVG